MTISIVRSEDVLITELPEAVVVDDNKQLIDVVISSDDTTILFERKKFPSNLVQDIPTGHVAAQLIDASIANPEAVCFLNLEGFPSVSVDGHLKDIRMLGGRLVEIQLGWKWIDVQMYLLSTYIVLGVIPIWTENIVDTSKLIKYLDRWANNPDKGAWVKRKPKTGNLFVDPRVEILSRFEGVGEKTAQNLLEKLGTIKNVVNSTEEDLANISRVGHSKANKIAYWANLEWKNE